MGSRMCQLVAGGIDKGKACCDMNAKRLLLAVCSAGLMGFCMADTISQNVVGYASTGTDAPRSGRIVNLFKRTCDYGEPTLKEAISANVEGVVIRFYDGSRWQRAVSAVDANDEVYWCDASTGDIADEYTCPHGAAIDYRLPDGEPDATLTFTGQADLAAVEASVGSMFSEEVTINDIKVSREAVRRIVGYPAPRKAEVVSVTNMPPTDFFRHPSERILAATALSASSASGSFPCRSDSAVIGTSLADVKSLLRLARPLGVHRKIMLLDVAPYADLLFSGKIPSPFQDGTAVSSDEELRRTVL